MPIDAALLYLLTQRAPESVAIAVGRASALVVWEEVSTHGQREVHAGFGYFTGSRKLLDSGGEPSELAVAYNGTGWTVAVCSNAWGIDNRAALVVWGEVDDDGRFTKQGEHSFGSHGVALACSKMWIEHGKPVMWVATRDEHCEAHQLDLATGALGKPRKLCRVWAAVGDDAFGIDEAGKPAHVDGLGTVTRAAVTAESDVRGTTIVTREQATVRTWAAPFKRPAHAVTLPKYPIDTTAPAEVLATADGVVLVQRHQEPESFRAQWLDAKGKRIGHATFGSLASQMQVCAAGDAGVYCAWDELDGLHARQIAPEGD